MNDLRERVAALLHQQWADYMRYHLSQCERPHGEFAIPYAYHRAIKLQIATPYADLTEQEKDADRAEADKVLALLTVDAFGSDNARLRAELAEANRRLNCHPDDYNSIEEYIKDLNKENTDFTYQLAEARALLRLTLGSWPADLATRIRAALDESAKAEARWNEHYTQLSRARAASDAQREALELEHSRLLATRAAADQAISNLRAIVALNDDPHIDEIARATADLLGGLG